MAVNWYASSVAYAAIPAFQASHAYSVGDIVRPTSPTALNQVPQRCTTAGTSSTEPTWNTTNNGTTTTGGATFTNVGGQATYGWAAACGNVASLSVNASKNISISDTVFVSSDHSESNIATNYTMQNNNTFGGGVKVISVNRGGSVPPVAADVQSGASIAFNGQMTIDCNCPHYFSGITFTQNANANIQFNSSGLKSAYFKNCVIVFTSGGGFIDNNPSKITLDNTTVQFGSTGSKLVNPIYSMEFTWINTPSAIPGATLPTTLINTGGNANHIHTFRGVDLSAITGTLVASNNSAAAKTLFEGCKINASATRYSTPGTGTGACDEVEFVNCYDGTKIFSERYTATGTLTTDRTTYMVGGATDDIGAYAHKLVSNANSDLNMEPFDSFWLDVENAAIGIAKTATIELVSSASLNNTDIALLLEYLGASGSPVTSFVSSLSSVLASSSALTTSSASWNSPPSTPVYQRLQVTFTPQAVGRVRGRVRLGLTSKTVWMNPQIQIN